MNKLFECDAQKLEEGINGTELTEIYKEACNDGKKNGYTPVIVVLDDTLEDHITFTFEDAGGSAIFTDSVRKNNQGNGKELFEEMYAELEGDYGSEFFAVDEEALDMMITMDDCSDENNIFPTLNTQEGEVYLVKVPTEKPYEIFAWLPFGGWNDCPDAETMIAMCNYWYDQYGAIPAMLSRDILSFYLETPVSDEETAINIAKEQCVFCPDLLGMGGMEAYIGMILNGKVWSFWWD